MSREIYVDRRRAASLRMPAQTLQFITCAAAIEYWRKLLPDVQSHTALVLTTGELYQPAEIEIIRFFE